MKPALGCWRGGGGGAGRVRARCQLSLSERLSWGVAASGLTEFSVFLFFCVIMRRSVPLTACEVPASCCGVTLSLGCVIGVACPGRWEKAQLDNPKEKHGRGRDIFVSRSRVAKNGFAGKSVREEASNSVPAPSALRGSSAEPPGPLLRRGPRRAAGSAPRRASTALWTCPCYEHGKISYGAFAEIRENKFSFPITSKNQRRGPRPASALPAPGSSASRVRGRGARSSPTSAVSLERVLPGDRSRVRGRGRRL